VFFRCQVELAVSDLTYNQSHMTLAFVSISAIAFRLKSLPMRCGCISVFVEPAFGRGDTA
jgi:hypothetical protein